MDKISPEQRSFVMSQIRGTNTKPEIILRKLLFANGIRYRLHYEIEGKPDIAIPSKKLAIFIDGCFWHKCPRCFRPPTSRRSYWGPKIQKNIKRDKHVNRILKSQGWNVIRIWEHQITKAPEKSLRRIIEKITSIS